MGPRFAETGEMSSGSVFHAYAASTPSRDGDDGAMRAADDGEREVADEPRAAAPLAQAEVVCHLEVAARPIAILAGPEDAQQMARGLALRAR